jgi:hypothetical protein
LNDADALGEIAATLRVRVQRDRATEHSPSSAALMRRPDPI